MRILQGVEEAFWWDVAERCDYATFFHTPLWHRLAERALNDCRDISFSAELRSGGRAVFPLLMRPRRYLRLFGEVVSTFAYCYGGPIADSPLTWEERFQLYLAADQARGRVVLAGNPLGGQDEECPRGFEMTVETTHMLGLSAPFDEIFAGFSKGHRSSTRQGRRAGVETRRATSIEDYRNYFDMYDAAVERWADSATSRYPWALFQQAHRMAAERPGKMVLWLGELDGCVVAGALVFYWNGHLSYWHGASSERGREASATNVVLADVIEDACGRGLNWFDFNPSGGHEGVAAFKRRFGAEEVPFPRYHRTHAPARFSGALARLIEKARR